MAFQGKDGDKRPTYLSNLPESQIRKVDTPTTTRKFDTSQETQLWTLALSELSQVVYHFPEMLISEMWELCHVVEIWQKARIWDAAKLQDEQRAVY